MDFSHIPVLCGEVIETLRILPDGVYIDGTAGGGGHSSEIAKRLNLGRLISIDKDPEAIRAAAERLRPYRNVTLVNDDFSEIKRICAENGISGADGILLDLGVSSYQLDNPDRGFSYSQDAPLDMRMSGKGMSAFDVVNTYSGGELTRIIREYGEERYAARIAEFIVKARAERNIDSTARLGDIIKNAVPAAARREGGHPAKRTFQAIRIEVNGELEHLKEALESGFSILRSGGRFAVISFHSLEDRIVKQFFADKQKGCDCPPDFPVCVCGKKPQAKPITKKPIEAAEDELLKNPRSKSANLRGIEKR